MKILLIDPPFYRFIDYYNRFFPLGLSYLAAVLQREEYEVMIYDADCNINPSKMDFTRLEDNYPIYLKLLQDNDHLIWKELRRIISSFTPDIVGITVWTTFAASAFKIASIIKEMNKDMPVIMGGPHVSIKYDEVLKICPDVDILVRGEGEETFLELVRTMEGKVDVKFEVKELKDICGISYRKNGEIFHNPPRNFIKDLDTIPFPARDLLLNKASYNSEDMGLLMTSRGCPYNCTYCATSIWERKTRYRSPDNVIEEIKFYTNDTIKKKSLTQLKNKLKELLSPTIQMKYHGLKLISGNKGFDVLLDFELYKDQKLMSVDELLDQIKKELNVEHPGMFQVMLEPAIAKNVPVKHASTLNSLVIKQSELVKDTSEFIITADEIVFSEKKKGADTSTK